MKIRFTSTLAAIVTGLLFILASFDAKAQYCTPTGSATTTYGISTVRTQLGITNFNNANSGLSSGGYGNFTTKDTISQMQGQSFSVQASSLNYNSYWAVYIDWNQDGDFNDPGELIYQSPGTQANINVSVFVPYSATAGHTRLRVMNDYQYAINSPCNGTSYMETEDYTLKVIAAPDCSGKPSAGMIKGSDTIHICKDVAFMLRDTLATGAGSMVYQWQKRVPSGTGTWVNITGSTGFQHSEPNGINVTTDYRFFVKCNKSNLSDTSNVVVVKMNSINDCYCVPSFAANVASSSSYFGYSYLNSVRTLGGVVNINRLNSGYSMANYQDFRNTDTLRCLPGNKITLRPTVGSSVGASTGLMAWIDWNHNGDFTDAGEEVHNVPYQAVSNSFDGSFDVPITALPVRTTMRVMVFAYTSNFGPCGAGLPTYYWGELEDYTVVVDSLPPCASSTFPTTVLASVDKDTLCVSGDLNLNLDTAILLGGVRYQWQKAAGAGGPWTDIDTGELTPSKTVKNINTNTWFRCLVLCNGNLALTSNTVNTVISDPKFTSAPSGGTRCGPGTVLLTAYPSTGSSANWYDQPVGGTPLALNTNTYTTYYIANTTPFYAAPSGGFVKHIDWVGTQKETVTLPLYGNPFGMATYGSNKQQMIITKSRMASYGFTKAGYIYSLGYDVLGQGNVDSFDFTLSIGFTNATQLSGWTPTTQVYSNINFKPTANTVNTFTFNTPMFWDGESSIVVETCVRLRTTAQTVSTNWTVRGSFNSNDYMTQNFRAYDYGSSGNYTTSMCNSASPQGYYNYYYPNVQLGIREVCEGPRQMAMATVTQGPAFTIGYDSVLCNNSAGQIAVTSPLNNYTQGYTWQVVGGATGNLYTNAAGTIGYFGGNQQPIYFKSTTPGRHRIAVFASNGNLQTNCAAADTADIWVQPGDVELAALPDSICATVANPSTDIMLMPRTGFNSGNYISWEESSNGTNYNTIPNSNTTVYKTPNLYTKHWYRANIKSDTGICESPEIEVVVVDPTINSVTDSFNCGPGQVTLKADGGANAKIVWYANDSILAPLGYGKQWQTPYLTKTDTFYVAAAGGSASVPGEGQIGNGTTILSSTTAGFYSYYGSEVIQFLYTKADMESMGFYGGSILWMAFNVSQLIGSQFDYQNFKISMTNTNTTALTTSTWVGGMQDVYSASKISFTSTGWYKFDFDQPFVWDGTSNVVVQWCWGNGVAPMVSNYPYILGHSPSPSFSYPLHYGYSSTALTAAQVCAKSGVNSNGATTVRPNLKFGFYGPCESARERVIAQIFPAPEVDLGPDLNECVDSGYVKVLNAGLQGYTPQFKWDNGSRSQVRPINQTGIYHVTVTNSYDCTVSDTVNVVFRHNPTFHLPEDTAVCEGFPVTLDPGPGGAQYFWNTGANTRAITVTQPGTYIVNVTSNDGCTKADTVVVDMSGKQPSFNGIMVTNNGYHTFKFNALNPQNVVGFDWDFGDGSPHSNQPVPSHTYARRGTYIVTLTSTSNCGSVTDSTSAHILKIGDVEIGDNLVSVYPNPTKEKATITAKDVRMEKVVITNVLGQKIYEAEVTNPYKHEVDLRGVASGVYNVSIQTDKGNTVRKLNVLK